MKKDGKYLIVGQGLAGTLLGLTLDLAGVDFEIIDNPGLSACSRISAGVFNPVVFKRYTTSWRALEVFPHAFRFYRHIEKLLGIRIFYEIPLHKILSTHREQVQWKLAASLNLSGVLNPDLFEFPFGPEQKSTCFGEVLSTGRVDVAFLLRHCLEKWNEEGRVSVGTFDFEALKKEENGWSYKEKMFIGVLFCEGKEISRNPFFSWVKMKPARGEVLVIKSKALPDDRIFHSGISIIPSGSGQFLVGSTYGWDNLSDIPDPEKINWLKEELKKKIGNEFSVVEERAGVRPSVIDRRPVLGQHPVMAGLWVMNGMGTRGVILGPWLAEKLKGALLGGEKIEEEISVGRFFQPISQHR
jgi:glycine oxidase